jgi:hypothetical protein
MSQASDEASTGMKLLETVVAVAVVSGFAI